MDDVEKQDKIGNYTTINLRHRNFDRASHENPRDNLWIVDLSILLLIRS